jgi:hypothetical protein
MLVGLPLAVEPVFEIEVEDNKQKEEHRKTDGHHMVMNFEFR